MTEKHENQEIASKIISQLDLSWTTIYAEQGYVFLQRDLALAYFRGWGVKKDESQALNWIKKLNVEYWQHLLSTFAPSIEKKTEEEVLNKLLDSEMFKVIKELAEKGDLYALERLKYLYDAQHKSYYLEFLPEKLSENLIEIFAEQGSIKAQQELSFSENNTTALKWLEILANHKPKPVSEENRQVFFNPSNPHYVRNEKGDFEIDIRVREAQYRLGEHYIQQKNIDKGIELFETSANYGNENAQDSLTKLFFKYNQPTQAVEWLKKISKIKTDKDESFYCNDNGYSNPFLKEKWIEDRFTRATRELAICYYLGKGVKKNYAEAIEYFRKSIGFFKPSRAINYINDKEFELNAENSYSQLGLAVCYYYGNGVEKNEEHAIKLFEKASEKGNAFGYLWMAYLIYLELKPQQEDFEKILKEELEKLGMSRSFFNLLKYKNQSLFYSPTTPQEEKEDDLLKQERSLDDKKQNIYELLKKAAVILTDDSFSYYGNDYVNYYFPEDIANFLENTTEKPYSNLVLAYYYKAINKTEKSLEHLKIASDKGDILANRELGLYYEKNEHFDEEIECFEKVIKDSSSRYDNRQKIKDFCESRLAPIKTLREKNKHLEEAQKKLRELVQNTSHLAGNLLRPNTQEKIAKKLKNSEFSEESKKLYYASSDIKYVKQQFKLLEIIQSLTGSEAIIKQIKLDQVDKSNNQAISIEEILNLAAFRAIDKLFDTNEYSLNFARETIEKQQGNFSNLSNEYQKYILETNENSDNLSIISWCSEKLRPINIKYQCDDWKKILFYNNSQSVALFFCYFFELFFNAFKYADHTSHDFLTITLANEFIDNNEFLTMIWINPKSDKTTSFGSNKGLNLSASYISLLNDDKYKDKSQELLANSDNVFEVITRIDRKIFNL